MELISAAIFICLTILPNIFCDSIASQGTNITEDYQPVQVHLAYGECSTEMVITWVSPSFTEESIVNYGITPFKHKEHGSAKIFIDGGHEQRSMWIHRVHIKHLQPNTTYFYNCGSNRGWSSIYNFKTNPNGTKWPVRVAMYGDLGVENPQSLSRLQVETEKGMYDAILHIGDLAYDMDNDNARIGDKFMEIIEPIAAYVPYMVCPGNHEQKYNFSNYRARFSMPQYQEKESLFYSWNIGTIHFISINTEAYYYLNYGLKVLSKQYHWLMNDLQEANKPENRAQRPWIIVYGHRPMYCSTTGGNDCGRKSCFTRVGLPVFHWYSMENLLNQYGIDLAVWAHEHVFERLWPIYNYQVLNGTLLNPYTNPRGPVHITTSSAGCKEGHDNFTSKKPYWSAFRSGDYGYTRLTAFNKTHLYWEQVSDDKNGEIIDKVWLIRDRHESYEEKRS